MTTDKLIVGAFAITLFALSVYNVCFHILPNRLTLPGIVVGVSLSYLFPNLHGASDALASMVASLAGGIVGGGVVFFCREGGKRLFGKEALDLVPDTRVVLTTTGLVLPEREIPYGDIFYRQSDELEIHASRIEMCELLVPPTKDIAGMSHVTVALRPNELKVREISFDPKQVVRIEMLADKIVFPREVLGFGLVKLSVMVGVFLGWRGTLFVLIASSIALALGLSGAYAARRAKAGADFDIVTPICISSIIWLYGHSHMIVSLILAVVLAGAAAFALHCRDQKLVRP